MCITWVFGMRAILEAVYGCILRPVLGWWRPMACAASAQCSGFKRVGLVKCYNAPPLSCCIFCVFLAASFPSTAQDLPKREVDIRHYLAEWEENEEVMEDLLALLQQPVDLNGADREDLETLFFLRPGQVEEILLHRQRFGPFLSLYELQVLPGFSVSDILNLQSFVVLSKDYGRTQATDHYLVYRTDLSVERAKGFRDSVFAGGPTRQYLRYKFQKGNRFSVGLLTEKDPGEKSLVDHQVISVQWKNSGKVDHLIIGDYQVHWGQGLLVGSGFKLGKGAEPVLGTKRGAEGFRVQQSVREYGGFRGAALQWRGGAWQAGAWLSRKRFDANRSDEKFSSVQTSGLHRTASEIEDANAVGESHIGSFVKYKRGMWHLGLGGCLTRYDAAFEKQDLPYNYFQFRGQTYGAGSISTVVYGRNYSAFAEVAYANSLAGALGLAYSASKKWEVGIHLRHYPETFHSMYGSAFGENTLPQNEVGQYLGLKFTPRRSVILSGHYDRYRFPWVKFGQKSPVHGSDYALRMIWQPNRSTSFKVVLRTKEESSWSSATTYSRGGQMLFDRKWAEVFRTQTSIQVKWVQGWGQAWMQDVEGKWKGVQWRGRVAWFSTASYDSRIYSYENDVLYTSSFPAYSGKGWRMYMNVKLAVHQRVDVWLRWARTQVEEDIGSGWDEVGGSRKTDLRLQVRFAL